MRYSAQDMLSNDSLDALIEAYRSGGSDRARNVAKSFSMEEFIFGLLPSDFLYYLPLNDQAKVLDVACGLGTHSFNIAKFAGEVYGCDPSFKKIAFCEARKQSEGYKNVHFSCSDIADLPFSSNTFDVIIASNSAGLLSKKESDLHLIYKLLKPGGMFYFCTHTRCPWKLKRALSGVEFEKIDFYIAHPSCYFPRFLIPVNDFGTLRFVLNIISADKGVLGVIVRFVIKIPLVGGGIRFFLPHYAVFIKK